MKKWITVLFAVLLAGNLLFSISLYTSRTTNSDGTTIVQNTINGYTTDLTEAIDTIQSSVVTVVSNGVEQSGIIYTKSENTVYVFSILSRVDEESSYSIRFDSGMSVPSAVVGFDADTHLALFACEPEFDVTRAQLGDSDLVTQGEYVISVGGRTTGGISQVGFGIGSSHGLLKLRATSNWVADVIRTDISVNSANTGSPLINLAGELIGLISDIPIGTDAAYGYAITVNEMRQVYRDMKSEEGLQKATLGIIGRSVSEMRSYEKNQTGLQLDQTTGVLVTEVVAGSSGDQQVLVNDLILKINDTTITDVSAYIAALYELGPEMTIAIELQRDGETQIVSVVTQ